MGAIDGYVHACPKVELHVHLEGAIRPARLVAILARHGDGGDPAAVASWFRHADFAEFLRHFRTVMLSLRDVQDVHDIARDLFLDLVAQHVVYAEVIFSAPAFVRAGMPLDEILAAASEAAAAAESLAAPSTRYNLVIDLVRNFGPDVAQRSVESIARAAHPRVVGIHLGGDEAAFPARDFAAAFTTARDAGLGCAAHAGEADGAASVRDAIDSLGATRIGHGIRSIEDAALVRDLVARGVTLEVCPTSNVSTGAVSGWDAHPLPQLLAAGVAVTIGADDPSFFDTDLERELLAVHDRFGLGVEAIDAFADVGLAAAFIPPAERATRLAALRTARAAAQPLLSGRDPRSA